VVADLADREALRRALQEFSPEAVVHFAASIVVPESVRKPLEYFRNNVANSLNLLEEVRRAGVKHFVFSSSAAVYGMPAVMPVPEEAPSAPINPYGQTKRALELMLADLSLAEPDFRYVALRYFNVAGADSEARIGLAAQEPTHLISRALKTALGHYGDLQVFGTDYPTPDGTCIRDYIHVEDLVDTHLLALCYLSRGGASQTFNCGYGKGNSVREVVQCVKEVTGVDFKVSFVPRREGDPAALVADPARIKSVLGWAARHDNLYEIVGSAWQWQKRFADM